MIKILEVCVDLDGGGIDRYLLNYCSRIPDIEFDFAVVEDGKIGILEEPIKALGSHIYRVPRQRNGIRENYFALKKIMTDTRYDAVHVHLGYKGAVALLCAKNCGIKLRMVHAHIANEPESFQQKCVRKGLTPLTKALATSLLACGVDAAKWVWGGRAYQSAQVTVINNAIQTAKYSYSPATREAVRRQLGIDDGTFVVGHVGRLCEQKNQLRLLDIFAQILERRPDALLLLVGSGNDEEAIRRKITQLDLENSVKLLGVRDDVPQLLNAFDVFVFPSKYEGLPFTLIETQCNGLPAISANSVTEMVKLGECVEFLSLDQSDVAWADKAFEIGEKGHSATEYHCVIDGGYDIDTEADVLRKYYIGAITGNK